MAKFNYTGFALIKWRDGSETIQFIDFAADTGTLQVWADDTSPEPEYRGANVAASRRTYEVSAYVGVYPYFAPKLYYIILGRVNRENTY